MLTINTNTPHVREDLLTWHLSDCSRARDGVMTPLSAVPRLANPPSGGTYRIRTGVRAIPMPHTWPAILTHHKCRYSLLYSLQISQWTHSHIRSFSFCQPGDMEPPVSTEITTWPLQGACSATELWRHMEARVDHDSTPTDYGTAILPTYTISPFYLFYKISSVPTLDIIMTFWTN